MNSISSHEVTFLRQIQLLLERTYSPVGINLESCLIGHQRYTELSALAGPTAQELSHEARTFLRVLDGQLYIAIYYHPGVIRALERYHPLQILNKDNIRPLIVFLEELNHAIHASLRFLENQLQIESENLLCDLELQAKVDTYLALKLIATILRKRRPLTQRQQNWLQSYLFAQESFDYRQSVLRNRYRETNQLGLKLVRYLDELDSKDRVLFMRRFRALSFTQKRILIKSLEFRIVISEF